MESYLTAEISSAAVSHNLTVLRQGLSRGTKLCAVVKADCYGHGLDLLLPVISQQADCIGIATPDEAIHLRRMGYQRPILMFFSACAYRDGQDLRDALQELIVQQVTLTVVSPAEVHAVAEAARCVNARADVHIKIDTGMGRSGTWYNQLGEMTDACRRAASVRLAGMYTHFATADETDKALTLEQLRRFLAAVDAAGGRKGLTLHAANSAGTIDLPATHLDMVRPGIAMYGYQPSDTMHTRLPLQPALRLWGRLMQVKSVPNGSSCGYGLTYVFRRDSRVGLVPVGYGDGYFRSLSNRSSMRVRGRDVPIRGNVSMDQIIIDLTDVPDAQVGDPVEIISPDPTAPHSVEHLARHAGTIPYEITCRLGRRVRRVLV
ncbi:MAG: alanine racemase [Phycisphaerae bacterium]|nr:alanine racemase [Phycisphaerae bacterium]